MTGCLIALLLASSGGAQPPSQVRIFAAASLAEALSAAIELFQQSHPEVRVIPQYGGSSDLARQITAGAPADLFFSADERQMARVSEAGLLEEAFREDVLSNQLVIVEPRSAASGISRPEDLRRVRRVAMADPEAVPAGVYARIFLEKLGLWEDLRSRVLPTLDVRAALAAVATGNAEAGFVYRTDVGLEPRVRAAHEVPLSEGPRIVYPLAPIRGRAESSTLALLRFLASEEARAVFERFGFVVLGGAE